MELSNAANDFVGSPLFSALTVAGIIAMGIMLRLTFRYTIPEYKHNPDSE